MYAFANQFAYDNAEPYTDYSRNDYVDAQVALLLDGKDADGVDFFGSFALSASEALAEADDNDYPLLQLVLAVRAGKIELAQRLVMHFDDALCDAAETAVARVTP